ncbi:MAG: ATP-binding protein [Actinophytocola sp.]|uniref:ATP-binding protein n=1 Tax=Actinophytocola sp. TaxID=1872138 RepID=UPI003D6A4B17
MRQEHEAKHHTIVVVDVEGFGDRRRTNLNQLAVRDGLYRVVRTTFDTVGVPWADCYREDRGDGMFILVPESSAKTVLVESLPPTLVAALQAHNAIHADVEQFRLRMALHAGNVHYDDHGVTSAALNLAFRLIDAEPVKAALATSPGVLAMITSDWFFEDIVRHHPEAKPDTYRLVSLSQKETNTSAWIALPDHPYPPTTLAGNSEPRPWVTPRQLPLAVRDFTGRAEHLAALDTLIPTQSSSEPTRSVVISAVDGTAGIGKTTLAVHWAHRMQNHFPDGTLHINLRGYGPGESATPGEVLDGFLRALGTPAEQMPIGVDAQAALYRSLLGERRMLIVLDNANSADQVRPLLPGAGGCMVLVTSRDSLTGLVVTEAAHRLTLDLLAPAEALALVTGIIGSTRAKTEPEAVADLISLCARLPLALRIAAGRVATNPHTTVGEVVAELADEHDRLDVLSRGGDERAAVRTVFDWSYQRLPAEHAQLFRRLGLHPGPDLSIPAAAAVAGLDGAAARGLLDDLASAHLIERAARMRYRFHDLLRAYATDQAHHFDHDDVRASAVRNLLDWYAHTARICDELVYIANPRLPQQLAAPVDYPKVTLDRPAALDWLESERANLLAALRDAARRGMHRHVLQFADSMRFLYLTGSWDEIIEVDSCGIAAAQDCGDRSAESFFHARRGDTHIEMRSWDAAEIDIQQALATSRALGDHLRHAWALNGFACLWLKKERFDDANTYLREALPLSRGVDTGRLEAVLEGNMTQAYIGLGHYQEALECGERSLELRRRAGDLYGEPFALHLLARAWLGLGEYRKVIDLCQQAISLGRVTGNLGETVAQPLDTLATALHHTGNTTEAVNCWQEAANLYDKYGRPYPADEIRRRLSSMFRRGGDGTPEAMTR